MHDPHDPHDPHDRRRHPRLPMVRPCKVHPVGSCQFMPGRTSNVSAGGALVEVHALRPFSPGDEITVTVAPDDARVLLSDSMVRARVVRADPPAHARQTLAIAFHRAEQLAQAA